MDVVQARGRVVRRPRATQRCACVSECAELQPQAICNSLSPLPSPSPLTLTTHHPPRALSLSEQLVTQVRARAEQLLADFPGLRAEGRVSGTITELAASPRSAAAAASASASSARATPSTAPKELRRRRLGSASLGALPWAGVLGCGTTGCELGGSSPARPPWGLWATAMPASGSAVTLSSSSAVGGGGEAERRELRSGEGRSAACSCA